MNATQTAQSAGNDTLLRDFEESLKTITSKTGGDESIAARKMLLQLGRNFDAVTVQPVAEKLVAVLPTITDYTSRYTTLTLLGDMGQKNSQSAQTVVKGLANYITQEKDSGLTYMAGQKLAALGSRFPALAEDAATAIASAMTQEKDHYARQSLSFSLATLGHISEGARDIAVTALGENLGTEKDTLARCLTAGTIADFGVQSTKTAQQTLEIFTTSLNRETTAQVANHITQNMAAVAKAQPDILPQTADALIDTINDKNHTIKQPEKIFAASHALRLLGEDAPQTVADKVADALTGNVLPETQRRVYILTLEALAKADADAAKTAHGALTKSLGSEPSALNRRHTIKGIMAAVKNGVDGAETAKSLFKHLDGERDRETRELVNRSLMTLGHPLPKVKPLIPQPRG